MKRCLMLALTLAATGCGGREALKPADGASLPPKPAFARETPTPDELMTADTQARPQRSDELIRRSQERRDDRFDQPPR